MSRGRYTPLDSQFLKTELSLSYQVDDVSTSTTN